MIKSFKFYGGVLAQLVFDIDALAIGGLSNVVAVSPVGGVSPADFRAAGTGFAQRDRDDGVPPAAPGRFRSSNGVALDGHRPIPAPAPAPAPAPPAAAAAAAAAAPIEFRIFTPSSEDRDDGVPPAAPGKFRSSNGVALDGHRPIPAPARADSPAAEAAEAAPAAEADAVELLIIWQLIIMFVCLLTIIKNPHFLFPSRPHRL